MTLVLTRLAPQGVAMAADTAVTTMTKDPSGKKKHTVTPSRTQKLFRITGLQAGVSCWGRGTINGKDTAIWLEDFIGNNKASASIEIFAARLGFALSSELGRLLDGSSSIGFHVAGYETGDADPTFFHVHDGKSDYFPKANRAQINVHRDCPPKSLRDLFNQGNIQEMRNGEFRPYSVVSSALADAFQELRARGWPSITVNTLEDLANYNVAEIRLMSNIYAMYGRPVIGGNIHSLTIPPSGESTLKDELNSSGATSSVSFEETEEAHVQQVDDHHGRSGYPAAGPPFAPSTSKVSTSLIPGSGHLSRRDGQSGTDHS